MIPPNTVPYRFPLPGPVLTYLPNTLSISLGELLEEVEGYKPQYEELENLNKLIQNEVIFNNPYCKHTMESLNVSWEELHNCELIKCWSGVLSNRWCTMYMTH